MCSVVLLLLYSNHLVGYMGVSIPGRTLDAWLILLTCRLVDSCSLGRAGVLLMASLAYLERWFKYYYVLGFAWSYLGSCES